MVGGGPDTQGGKGLLWHWPRGVGLESSGGNFKSPAHSLHHLTQLPSWVLGRSRHRYRHPQGQTDSAFSGLEGGVPVRDISVSAQGV